MKRNIYLLYAMTFLQGMVFYGAIATLYRQAQGVTIFQITLIESISYALCIALEVPWGVVADRIGYKRTMVLCCWLYFLSKIIFWQASDFGGFLAERVLLSVVIAGLSGVDTSILYLCAGPENSQHVFGVYESLGMAGLLTASAVYTLFIGENYRLAALLTMFSYGAAALLSLGLTEVRPASTQAKDREPFAATLRATLTTPGLLVFLLAVGLLTEIHQTVTVFLNQLQYERCGMSDTTTVPCISPPPCWGCAASGRRRLPGAPVPEMQPGSSAWCLPWLAVCWLSPTGRCSRWGASGCCSCPTACSSPSRCSCRTARYAPKTVPPR